MTEERPIKWIIGRRIREARRRQNLKQDELVLQAKLGWNRQTLGQVENGEREIKAWELARIADVLNLEMTALLRLDQKENARPIVLWRKKPENYERLEAIFIRLCKDYKFLEDLNERKSSDESGLRALPSRKINLQSFHYSHAYALAEEIRGELGLGDYPATALVKVLEEKYGLKFFFGGLEENASAASSVSEYGRCIVINPSEPVWRQHFSVAHELFHIITWDDRLIKQIISDADLWNHNEKLANAFASGLLVPTEPLRRAIRQHARKNKLHNSGIVSIACQFSVSLEALLWRMCNQHIITKDAVERALADYQLRQLARENRYEVQKKDCLSNRFVRLAYLAYTNGEISRGRLAKMLRLSLSELSDSLQQFGLTEVSDDEIALSYT